MLGGRGGRYGRRDRRWTEVHLYSHSDEGGGCGRKSASYSTVEQRRGENLAPQATAMAKPIRLRTPRTDWTVETLDAARHRVSTTKTGKRKMNQKTIKKAKNRQNWTQKHLKATEGHRSVRKLRTGLGGWGVLRGRIDRKEIKIIK